HPVGRWHGWRRRRALERAAVELFSHGSRVLPGITAFFSGSRWAGIVRIQICAAALPGVAALAWTWFSCDVGPGLRIVDGPDLLGCKVLLWFFRVSSVLCRSGMRSRVFDGTQTNAAVSGGRSIGGLGAERFRFFLDNSLLSRGCAGSRAPTHRHRPAQPGARL